MVSKTHTIEVDEATARALRGRADAEGISVSKLVAGMAALAEVPVAITAEEVAALDRQVAAIRSGEEATFQQEDVERWLATWGTPDYKPFPRKG